MVPDVSRGAGWEAEEVGQGVGLLSGRDALIVLWLVELWLPAVVVFLAGGRGARTVFEDLLLVASSSSGGLDPAAGGSDKPAFIELRRPCGSRLRFFGPEVISPRSASWISVASSSNGFDPNTTGACFTAEPCLYGVVVCFCFALGSSSLSGGSILSEEGWGLDGAGPLLCLLAVVGGVGSGWLLH